MEPDLSRADLPGRPDVDAQFERLSLTVGERMAEYRDMVAMLERTRTTVDLIMEAAGEAKVTPLEALDIVAFRTDLKKLLARVGSL